MTTATPSDVRDVIDTSLDDAEIQAKLDRAQEDNKRVNDTAEMDTTQLRRIEELLASIKILSQVDRERSETQKSVGDASKTFEQGKIESLKIELRKWDPSNELADSVIRDSSRNTHTTAED